jgi:mRNA deadenylase 3'-5' endonuclease subunit Ccr4
MQRTVRVATYNVLSSSLCSASYFSHVADEKFCSSKYRLEGLLTKLSTEIDKNAIICLQEVSLAWTGKLHAFLEAKNYGFVVSNYGTRFNGSVSAMLEDSHAN